MSKRNSRGFNFERMEDRRLLAADFGMEALQCGTLPAETCMTASVEIAETSDCQIDSSIDLAEEPNLPSTEAESEADCQAVPAVSDDIASEPTVEGDVDCVVDDVSEPVTDSADANPDVENCSAADSDASVESEVDVSISTNQLRDPVGGTSGYFGEIDPEEPTESISFTPSEVGSVQLVVASSFGDADTTILITDSRGDLVMSSSTEDMEGFQELGFDVDAGETYEIVIGSDDCGEGHFMVTVAHVANSETAAVLAQDVHADEIGGLATELTLEQPDCTIESTFVVESELESSDDMDAFRFVAATDGDFKLELEAESVEHQSDAVVSVFDAEGVLMVAGSTNDEVAIRFGAEAGVEYHVLVDSQNDIQTSYSLLGTLIGSDGPEEDTPGLPLEDLLPDAIEPADLAMGEELPMTADESLDAEFDCDIFPDVGSDLEESLLVDQAFAEMVEDQSERSGRRGFGGNVHRFRNA